MLKKFISALLSISMLLSMASVANVFAATSEFINLDLSSFVEGGQYLKTSDGLKSYYKTVDGRQTVAFGTRNEAYTDNNGKTANMQRYVTFSSANAMPADTKGIYVTSTFKMSGITKRYLRSLSTHKYIDLYDGFVRTSNTSDEYKNTGLTYEQNKWYTINLAVNYTTGYYTIDLTDLATNTTTSASGTESTWVLSSEDITTITSFRWTLDTNSTKGYGYIAEFSVDTEDDADAIKEAAPTPPSRIVVRDDFDSYASNIAAPWTSTTIPVETTNRGKSATLTYAGGNDGKSMTVSNADGILNAAAKGLVVEFSTKLTYTSDAAPNFIVSVNDYWFNTGKKIMQFKANGTVDRNDAAATADELILNAWVRDKWYDVRIEISFDSAGSATYRYIVFDGAKETVKVFENVSTTLFNDPSAITKIQFTYANAAGTGYVDNVNIYWLEEEAASGIRANIVNPVDINLENYAEGTDEITADMTCETPFATYSGEASYAVESVKNSGRSKSLKITSNNSYEFYRGFEPIQNGTVSFDIMFPEINGTTVIKSENDGEYVDLLTFNSNGDVTNSAQEDLGQYEAGKWYKLIVTAGSENDEGYQNFKLIGDTGVIAEGSLEACDSVSSLRVLMEDSHSIYIDNFKAYAPVATPAGIYPVGQSVLKEGAVLTGSKIVLPFSKPVDLSKSEFKVNGEEVTATGYEIITLDTAVEEGEEYTIEYTVYDLDGFKTEGYISGISCEDAFITVSDFEEANLQSPTATATVKVSKPAGSKEIILYVAAYKASEMIALDFESKTLIAETGNFTAAVDATGADEIKTFLWDGKTLTPIK